MSAAARAVDDAASLCDRMVELEARWRSELRPRRGSAADRILPFLIAQPVLTASDVETLLGVSRQAAAQAVRQLLGAGVITQVGGGQRRRLFEGPEVFAVLTDYERGLATESGDTRSERPRRPCPTGWSLKRARGVAAGSTTTAAYGDATEEHGALLAVASMECPADSRMVPGPPAVVLRRLGGRRFAA